MVKKTSKILALAYCRKKIEGSNIWTRNDRLSTLGRYFGFTGDIAVFEGKTLTG
jgi:hypothetical protein